MSYRWKIDTNVLEGGEINVEGPRGRDETIKSNHARFAIFDDDGVEYLRGSIWGDYDGFEPLDDYGMPCWGATDIRYNGKSL